jgi:hypothetical protein
MGSEFTAIEIKRKLFSYSNSKCMPVGRFLDSTRLLSKISHGRLAD